MALDPRLALQVKPLDTASPLAALVQFKQQQEQQQYDRTRTATQDAQAQEQQQYDRGLDAQKMEMAQQQFDMSKEEHRAKMSAALAELPDRDMRRIKSTTIAAAELNAYLQAGDTEGARRMLANRKKNLMKRQANGEDIDTEETDAALKMLDEEGGADKLKSVASQMIEVGQVGGWLEFPKVSSEKDKTKVLGMGQNLVATDTGRVIAQGQTKPPAGMKAVTNIETGETTFVSAKPLPPSISKQQDELMGDLRTSSSLQSDLTSLITGLDEGNLDLGIVNNQLLKARNLGYLPNSPESRNMSNTMAQLQKMRNDSLRLNKGTQTEFDAKRAWAEILGDDENDPSVPRDEKLLASALKRISAINERAVEEKKIRIETFRNDYGQDQLDLSGITNTKPSFEMENRNGSPASGGFKYIGVEGQ